MLKRIVSVSLALVMALGVIILFSTIPGVTLAAGGQDSARAAIAKVSETVDAAGPIHQKLKETIADEIASLGTENDSEPDLEESRTGLKEMEGYTEQLKGLLAGLNGLSDNPETSDGKTVRAAREYLTMLKDMTSDLSELIGYSIDLYEAVLLMDGMDVEVDGYDELAQQIWDATNATKDRLEQIKPPPYFVISHNDLIIRVTEFRDFAVDFYTAGELEDPLRIYSCIYRMDRIVRMFDICSENLDADIDMELRQAERRLNGPIALIHEELTRNLDILKNS